MNALLHPSVPMAWGLVAASGLFEIVFSVLMKECDGFTRPLPTAGALVAGFLSIWLMSLALRAVALGPAYAVWAGIGTLGTALMATWLYAEPVTPLKGVFMLMVVVGIVGLQMSEA